MKGFFITTICVMIVFFTTIGQQSLRKDTAIRNKYLKAVSAGTDAGVKHTKYIEEQDLEDLAYGFGEGYQHRDNIKIDKNESLKWFYEIFFRELGIQDSIAIQEQLKQYIPMKCIIGFDSLSIADEQDNWVTEKEYIISYLGKNYMFTLSDQMKDMETGIWIRDIDIGLTPQARKTILAKFIKEEIENFINNDSNKQNPIYYTVNLGLNDLDFQASSIKGSNMVVFIEGMPLPSLNYFYPTQKLYTFAMAGSEITRQEK